VIVLGEYDVFSSFLPLPIVPP